MGALAVYILKSSLLLAVLVSLFMIFMSRETFHKLNRYIMLFIVALSLTLPLFNVGADTPLCNIFASVENAFEEKESVTFVEEKKQEEIAEELLVPTEEPQELQSGFPYSDLESFLAGTSVGISPVEETEPFMSESEELSGIREVVTVTEVPVWLKILAFVYLLGVAVMFVRQIATYIQVARVISRGKEVDVAKLGYEGVRLRVHEGKEMPFSWFGWVVVSEKDLYEGAREIILHETAHARAGHSWDVLLADAVIMVQWFNPLAWIMKNNLKDIHEFEADEAVINSGVNAKQYQLLIIKKAVGARLYSIANSFNHSLTKKRITMMCKEKSKRWSCAKALYILPVAAVAALAFSTADTAKAVENMSVGKGNELVANEENLQMKNVGFSHPGYIHMCCPSVETGNKESCCLALNIDENGNVDGYFRGSSNELAGTREGYLPGYFEAKIVNAGINKDGVITFSINGDGVTFFEKPVPCECGVVHENNNGELWKNNASYFDGAKADFKLVLNEYPELPKLINCSNASLLERNMYVIDIDSADVADEKHRHVESMPEFPGGNAAMMRFIAENIKYPSDAIDAGKEGKAVVSFVIKKDGSIKDLAIEKSSGDKSLDAEAMRVVGTMPEWKPGMVNGKAVNVSYYIPVMFKLAPGTGSTPVIELKGGAVAVDRRIDAVVVVDGEVYNDDMSKIDSKTIESVTVLKIEALTEEDVEKYRAHGKSGVILIETKNVVESDDFYSFGELEQLKGEKVYRAVEQQPEFPGGLGELMAYLSTHIRYPQKARDFNAQGKVYVRFVVTADGCIDRVSVEKDEISTAFQVATELESLEKHIVYYERHVEECEREVESLKPVLERLKKEYGDLENDGAEPAVLERKKDEIQVLMSGISSLEGALKYWRTELDGVRTHFEKSRNALEEVTVVSYKNGKSGDYSPDKQYELNKAAIQSLRDESVRVVKSMPKWNPGKQGGKNVNVEMTLPITFRLQ